MTKSKFVKHAFFACMLLCSALPSCASKVKVPLPPVLRDNSEIQDVNGFLPQKVLIRTMTQSYCKYYDFVLVDGRIYSKKAGTDNWELFLKTGLPFSKGVGNKFETPAKIYEICADADSLYAFDDQGFIYGTFIADGAPERPFRWKKLFGFPKFNNLQQNDQVVSKRGWSMGCRRGDILWYEDIYGNQHHYGTMGLETLYFLTSDGMHIRFTDSGLPPDFSRQIEVPLDGRFISENISVSGDTIFLIGNRGTMFTRLIDFDTMGCDPMFFQYTYDKVPQKYSGREYLSNYSPWALPAEDWKRQEGINLEGKARLTKMISIAQTGLGNESRELRVAGTDKDGKTGFYSKMLNAAEWKFVPADLVLDESVFLNPQKEEIGPEAEFSYEGYLLKNGTRMNDVTCSITGVSLASEDKCSVSVRRGTEVFESTLFCVEKWTYMRRYDPGFDGTARYYFITPEFDAAAFAKYSEGFRALLDEIFGSRNHELFVFSAEVTEHYFQFDAFSQKRDLKDVIVNPNKYTFFAGRGGVSVKPELFKRGIVMDMPILKKSTDPSLMLEPGKTYSIRDRSEIETKIAGSTAYRDEIKAEIKMYKNYENRAGLSRWGYSVVDLLTKLTFLNQINFPKIKQITSFGDELMETNANSFANLASFRDWTYPNIIELLDERIHCYKKLIKDFDNNKIESVLDPRLKNNFSDFYQQAGLPVSAEEYSSRGTAVMQMITIIPYYPGYVLSTYSGEFVMVMLKDSVKKTLDYVPGQKHPLKIETSFITVSAAGTDSEEKHLNDIDKASGTLVWDGTTLSLYSNKRVGKQLLFKSTSAE